MSAPLAQLVEQWPLKPTVAGSNPARCTGIGRSIVQVLSQRLTTREGSNPCLPAGRLHLASLCAEIALVVKWISHLAEFIPLIVRL